MPSSRATKSVYLLWLGVQWPGWEQLMVSPWDTQGIGGMGTQGHLPKGCSPPPLTQRGLTWCDFTDNRDMGGDQATFLPMAA